MMKQQIVTKKMRQSGNESCSVFFYEKQRANLFYCVDNLEVL